MKADRVFRGQVILAIVGEDHAAVDRNGHTVLGETPAEKIPGVRLKGFQGSGGQAAAFHAGIAVEVSDAQLLRVDFPVEDDAAASAGAEADIVFLRACEGG